MFIITGHLSPTETDGDMLGYDLYSSALADILSEPTMQPPICVGLYAQWGSGKSFLLKKLEGKGHVCVKSMYVTRFSLVFSYEVKKNRVLCMVMCVTQFTKLNVLGFYSPLVDPLLGHLSFLSKTKIQLCYNT